MKKLLSVVLLGLFISLGVTFLFTTSCHAADRQCPLIWDNVAGHNFILTLGDQDYDVRFSDSYAGPCPIGELTIYDGVYIAPRFRCNYHTGNNNSVVLELGNDSELTLYWWKGKLQQIIIPDNAIILKPKPDDE